MKAIVLAAGRGERLGSLTEAAPKPMLPIAGRPLIGYVLDLLAKSQVQEVFINLHHHPDALRTYCGDGAAWGIRITYAVEPELLGTAGALRNFRRHLDGEPFFVVYGDNYYADCDLAFLWEFHHQHKALATLALFEKDDVTGSGAVGIEADGRITHFVEKPPPSAALGRFVNGGLYVVSPLLLPLLPTDVPCDFGYHVFPRLLAAGVAIYGRVMEGTVFGIDTPDLYRELRRRIGDEPA